MTGSDKSYVRSVYEFVSDTEDPKVGMFRFITLKARSLEAYSMQICKDHRKDVVMSRDYREFVPASPAEIKASKQTRAKNMVFILLKLLNGPYPDSILD